MREDQAWLLQSRVNPRPVPGALALSDGRISFRIDPEPSDAELDWLESALGIDDLAGLLTQDEPVIAFDFALADCAVSWPITGGGSLMIVRTPGGGKWFVSYDQPSTAPLSQPLAMLTGRRRARELKKALAKAGA